VSHKQEFGRTICARCEKGKLAKELAWGGAAVIWYCLACGWINRWNRVGEEA
jgi:RNase P subunit RPR2